MHLHKARISSREKVYNIPNRNGGYDYVEVNVNNDLTLDRNNAIFISAGKQEN